MRWDLNSSGEKGDTRSIYRELKRQPPKPKRQSNEAGLNMRREKQSTWVNYLV